MEGKSMSLKAQHAAACVYAKLAMAERGKVDPVILIPDGEDLAQWPAPPWRNPAEKAHWAAIIKEVLNGMGIASYSFVSEAWMARIDPRTQPEMLKVPVREHSQRQDVLMVTSRNRNGEALNTTYPVTYGATGEPPVLGAADHTAADRDTGLMTNFFE
jgi:hypothetical protein